jgi:uncharacterized protein YdaU (DUF1376 family)
VNWFKLYIGDYQRDTAHLSILEHGAYMLMLQHYYATEQPLPVGKALHRMLRAQDKAEREAIDSVAKRFWTQTDAGLVNARADEEITKASTQAITNRAIAVERERRRKETRSDSRTEHESWSDRDTKAEPNQTPDTREIVTTSSRGDSARAKGARLSPDWVPSEIDMAWARAKRPDLDLPETLERFREYWLAKSGQSATKLDWSMTWKTWVRNEKAPPPRPQRPDERAFV